MIQRSSVIIDPKKSKKFVKFIKTSAKDKQFWENVKKGASVKIDKEELNKLFDNNYGI